MVWARGAGGGNRSTRYTYGQSYFVLVTHCLLVGVEMFAKNSHRTEIFLQNLVQCPARHQLLQRIRQSGPCF